MRAALIALFRRHLQLVPTLLVVLTISHPIAALALDVPAPLAPWQGWVLDKHPDAKCTRVAANITQRVCVWPGRLALAVSEKGGSFSQSLLIEGAGWVALPGDREHWPQGLTLNGRAASAFERNGAPVLWLESGDYVLRGNFDWSGMPQSLLVPETTALLDLNLDGKTIANPNRDGSRLWLRTQVAKADAGAHDSVKVEVFRKIRDEIPRVIETTLRLSVSGKARELRLGRMLLANAEPIEFDSQLPARIEDDGSLRVQARAGEWTVRMNARLLGDINTFAIERQGEDWPTQEVWAFAANQALRRAQVGGAPSVDPSQLDLPAGFENLPVYLLDAQSKLTLEQQYRGDATPAPDEFSLQRTLWLDFEGSGATFKDQINGTMAQGWRLNAQPGVHLGRVRIDGEPRLVTQVQKDSTAGVEIRNPQVNLEAVSRVDDIAQLNATGWQSDFNNVQVQLLLPPGWKLWHASGPDQVNNSWLSRWNLWAIFLSLLIVAAVFRLLDVRWAAVAALTVALVYHENLALIILLLPLLVIIALLKVVNAVSARQWLQRFGFGFGILLALAILAFAVTQIRGAIYPQLEISYPIAANPYEAGADASAAYEQRQDELSAKAYPITASSAPKPMLEEVRVAQRKRYEAADNVQTGPGEPKWNWQPITLSWSGPVKADQPLHLYMTGNWMTRVLKIFDVLLIVALAAGVIRKLFLARGDDDGNPDANSSGNVAALLLIGVAIAMTTMPSPVFAESTPPQEMLDELEKRLLRDPACTPDCAATESASIQIRDDQLAIKLRVTVLGDFALALPHIDGWQPRSVLVDGLQASAVARGNDGNTLLPLAKGNHDITLEGPVASDDISLQFSSRPHVVHVDAEAWDVFGVNRNMLASNSVQLQKRQRTQQQDALLPAPEKPFVIIRREFSLGLDWRITTIVERIAPQQGAINLSVPVLPGESIVDGAIEAKDGAVAVSLGTQQRAVSWESQLKPTNTVKLSAPQTQQWVEVWSIDADERWHVEGEGFNPIKNSENSTQRIWQPWPGETLTLQARQPIAVAGANTTVESSEIKLTPGKRSSTLEVNLAVNSSIGGDYRVALHEPNVLKSVAVNGADISQSRTDEKLVLPLVPGENKIVIRWELERGADFITRTPSIALDTGSTNIDLTLSLSPDRWPLWVSGPRIGPAMLYWGVLVVLVGVAIGLGRITRRYGFSVPLKTWEWLLLFIGISTVNTVGSVPVLLWFIALEARNYFFIKKGSPPQNDFYYLMQVGIGLLSLIALMALVAVIPQSLLSAPDMQVTGNGSSNYLYRWYQDRSGADLPQALVVSVPLWIYRIAMLVWSLWLAFALLRWVKWGWAIFAAGGVWPKMQETEKMTPSALRAPPPTSQGE